ncbi:4,4-dimethylsterol C-4alpha-methyl-monooxygenase [Acrasis kona]|uniref:4,4-dimethylsterol C-4alpha-methyl-monooxygenase n=1 Tax=Acrasis kona TaxID=1008807 RepID=A0AAW2Z6N5_9EUKA
MTVEGLWIKYGTEAPWYVTYCVYSYLALLSATFVANLPFLIIEVFFKNHPYIVSRQINPKKSMPTEKYWKIFKGFMRGLLTHSVGSSVFAGLLFRWRGCSIGPLPSILEVVVSIFCFMLIEDTLFYWIHRLLHWSEFLYKHVHIHHHEELQNTVSVGHQYFHAIELSLGAGLPFIAGPLLLKSHMVTFFIWTFVMMIESSIAHCGYDFPFLNFIQDARVHAYHHSHYMDNYGSYFNLWDKLLGTNKNFKQYEQRRLAKQK